jgi:hypothetical protein
MRIHCDECVNFINGLNAECRKCNGMRFKTPGDYQDIQLYDWGWMPRGGRCEDYVPFAIWTEVGSTTTTQTHEERFGGPSAR